MAFGDIINTSTLTQTFDDEFNSFASSADGSTGLWRTTLMNDDRTLGSNGEEEYYSDSSVGVNPFTLGNGVLTIQAAPAAAGSNALNLPYTSGVITTEDSFNQLYGYFEIDAKMPAGQGLWPAFWLLPASGAWPPELDAFEVLGNDPTTLYFSTHSNDQATQGTTLKVANVSSGYNLYGVMWGPQTVELYINNVEVASMPTPADMNVPMYMLANLAVGGYWPGDPNSSTAFPADMDINYVRAYAYPGTTGGTVYDTTAAENIGTAAVAPVITLPSTATVPADVTTALGGVSFSSNWPGGFFTVQIGDTSGDLSTSATTDVFTSGEGSDYLTLSGNLAPLNAALASLTYDGSGNEYIWITVTDPQGLTSTSHIALSEGSVASTGTSTSTGSGATGTSSTGTGTVSTGGTGSSGGTTTSSGSTPVVATPGSLNAGTGATTAVSGVSIEDSQGGTITVTVSDSTGLLSTQAESGVTATGENSTALTLSGTVSELNTELATLAYKAGSTAGTDWLWVSANDPDNGQGLGSVVVTTSLGSTSSTGTGTPVVTAPGSLTGGTSAVTAVRGISVADSQGSSTITVVVSDSTGLLNTGTVSGVTAKGENSTALTLTGTVAELNTELASLSYTGGSAAGTDWLWVAANDPDGKQGLGHVVVTTTAASTTSAPPSTPVVATPATIKTSTGAVAAVSGVRITDSVTSAITVTVSDTTGILNTQAESGVTVKGEDSNALTLTGTVAELNTELATLTYTAGSAAGTDWLWVSAAGPNGTQGLGHAVVTTTLATVSTPVIDPPATISVVTGATAAISDVNVADSGYTGDITVVVSDNTGLLSATGTSGVSTKGEGSTALTLTGTVADINTELASLTYKAGSTTGSEWLWISAEAPGGTQGLGHIVMDTTTPVSTVPVVTTPGTATIASGAARALTGISVADSGSGTVSVAVSDSAGLLNIAAASGVTIKGEGTDDLTLNGSLAAVNADLASLTYTANGSASSDWLWVSATNPNGVQGINHVVVSVTKTTNTAMIANTMAPAGVTMTPVTGGSKILTSTGLAGSQALINFAETGGKASDAFTYSLSGSGASVFSLSSGGALSTAASGVAGATSASLYALDVTATDTTANISSASQALDVVVGGNAQSTLALATLSGFPSTTPSFIYAGSANVKVDATGLSAKAVFFAGAGADAFTGGSGANDYVFGATANSLADVITNFQASKDILDFSGLSSHLNLAGSISGASLAADSIGFSTVGSDTYVYANTSGIAEALNNTNMRVELMGALKLTAANFVV